MREIEGKWGDGGILSKVLEEKGRERGKLGANGGNWRQMGVGGCTQ